MCMSADEYPVVPQVNPATGFSIPQKTMKSMILQTKYACAVTDTKPALMGCKFEVQNVFLVYNKHGAVKHLYYLTAVYLRGYSLIAFQVLLIWNKLAVYKAGFSIPQKTMKSMILQTKYACAVTDTKPALMGCKFEPSIRRDIIVYPSTLKDI